MCVSVLLHLCIVYQTVYSAYGGQQRAMVIETGVLESWAAM